MRTVKIGNQEALVQTLLEWLNQRITQIRYLERVGYSQSDVETAEKEGRLIELLIIREKVLDGRIQEIGFDKEFVEGEV